MAKIISLKKPQHIDKQVYKELLTYVSKEKGKKLSKYYLIEDAYRSLLGELLIRSEICRMLSISNTNIRFKYNKNGKPDLVDERLYFNVSHSKEWIVAIFGEEPVGIDVEYIERINIEEVFNFFSVDEILSIKSKSKLERLNYFYDIWTLKESYVKCLGKGLFIPFNSFSIVKNVHNEIEHNMSNNYNFKQYDLAPSYKLSACSTSESLPENVVYRDFSEVWSILKHSNHINEINELF